MQKGRIHTLYICIEIYSSIKNRPYEKTFTHDGTFVNGSRLERLEYFKNSYRGYVDAGHSIGVGDYEFGRFLRPFESFSRFTVHTSMTM